MIRILDQEAQSYIKGHSFSNGISFRIAEKNILLSRIQFLTDYCRGKNVLHVGCTDHIPLIKEKILHNTWLHKCIEEVSSKQIGIDVDQESIEYINTHFGFNNIICMDIINDPVHPDIQNEVWDILLLGEVLEHINNPVDFLTSIQKKYGPLVKEIIITVPNAFSLSNFINVLFKNSEHINTDHRYWFTPFTLTKILSISGFRPTSIKYATYYPLRKSKKIRNLFLKILFYCRPVLRGDLIMIAEFEKNN
jgi:2-polyprenyl-3-methyl-5-hydroxy-6-metoxy-1,4-benzoquinol methylase